MSSRQYAAYCLVVSLVLVGIKLWLGTEVPTTALFADDHEYLTRSIYFVHGNITLTGYPFSKIPYGPLYPLVISPWMLFADPASRITAVFAINAVLSATAVFFGSLTVFRLTDRASLLVPLCLAAFSPLFLFSFYAMSENLVFALVALVGWLVVDFERTCEKVWRIFLLLLSILLLPLVRVPGLAVLPAVLWLFWIERKRLLRRPGTWIAVGLATVLPIISYIGFYRLGIHSWREAQYLASIWAVVSHADMWLFPLRLAVSQVGYLFFSTGYWILPVFIVVAMQVREWPDDERRRRWIHYLAYAGIAGGMFVGFTLAHLVQKLRPADAYFIYGRYNDPAGIILLVGGLAGVLVLRPQVRLQHFVLRTAAPLCLCLMLAWLSSKYWSPVNQCGLAIYAGNKWSLGYLVSAVTTAALLNQLSDRRRLYAAAAMLFLLAFSLTTDRYGLNHTITWARRGARSVAAARWISANVPIGARIGYDASIMRQRHPYIWKREMGSVYRAMMFRTYPRRTILVNPGRELNDVDYFFTKARGDSAKNHVPLWKLRLRRVWTDGGFALYRVPKPRADHWRDG